MEAKRSQGRDGFIPPKGSPGEAIPGAFMPGDKMPEAEVFGEAWEGLLVEVEGGGLENFLLHFLTLVVAWVRFVVLAGKRFFGVNAVLKGRGTTPENVILIG
jgi:hypothetical protein